MTVEISNLWKSLCEDVFADTGDDFLETFRRPGGANSRLAAWDPLDKTMRYYKFLLYTAAARQPERFFTLYRALGDVSLGQPVSVSLRGLAINLDHLFAVDEAMFLEQARDAGPVRSIVEIGAGFGRTCHAMMALSPLGPVEEYVIVDLPQVLALSQGALARLIPQHFHKVRFVDATKESEWRGLTCDLAINIDSFQEMPPATIDSYRRDLIAHCRLFYVKNPIGKYDPTSVGITATNARALQDVFSLGYCRDVIDIFNDVALEKARPAYLDAYRPGADWQVVADRPLDLFPYYHHTLYRRT
jgi:putative sugar O-methyltransferase